MTTSEIKESKQQLVQEFQKIRAERKTLELKIATKQEEAEKVKNQELLATASTYTVDSIVKGLADLQLEFGGIVNTLAEKLAQENSKLDELNQANDTIANLTKIQLGFGSAANELSEQLSTKASKLAEITEAVNNEIEQLTQLHNLEVSEDILDTLIQTYDDNAKTYAEEYNERYEVLSQEVLDIKNSWKKEQEEHQQTVKERNENLNKTRQRDEAEYNYDLELQRKLASDEYQQQQKLLNKELEESKETTDKQWNEREKSIADREKEFAELKAKVEAFPKEKEAAVKKATDEGKGIASYQAKVKADLYAKEVEGQKRFYEQRLQSLEQTITNQETRIQNLSNQLDSALKQVQDLAVKAIEGTANVNSYQAMKEIALEQAKGQVKNK